MTDATALSSRAAAGDPLTDLRERAPVEYALQLHRRSVLPFAPILFALVAVPLGPHRARGALDRRDALRRHRLLVLRHSLTGATARAQRTQPFPRRSRCGYRTSPLRCSRFRCCSAPNRRELMTLAAAGFVRRSTTYGVVDLRADLEPVLAAIDLFAQTASRDSNPRMCSERPGTRRACSLPGPTERAVLRWLRHGGLLGQWLGGVFVGVMRVRRELVVNAALRVAGAPVPVPLFCAARRVLGPLYEVVYATVLETQTRDGLAFAPPRRIARVLAACAAAEDAVRRFHDAGGRHADLHLENLLLRDLRTPRCSSSISIARAGVPPPAARRLREDRSSRSLAREARRYCTRRRARSRTLLRSVLRRRPRCAAR